MLISVITVSYNSAEGIERTIRSVIQQDYNDYEYVIIDGGSCDGTVDIIKNHESSISFWVSEPDSGIYNAMNKGVMNAKGDYCIFMNAGDMFYSPHVLSEVSVYLCDDVSIVMGNQIYLTANGKFAKYGRYWREVTSKRLFFDSLYHQASFINRKDLLKFPYDESLKMVSDWKEALLLLLSNKRKYLGVDVDIDYFVQDGITSTNKELGNKERQIVLNQFFTEEQQYFFMREFRKYKHPLNLSRYYNFICESLFNVIKFFSLKKHSI